MISRFYFFAVAAFLFAVSVRADDTVASLSLFYTNAAVKWTEALPVGNGRLGAMIFGGQTREHLQLNESTLWAGGPYDPSNTNALAALPEARKLVFEGKYDDAQKLIGEKMMSVPMRQMAYQALGDLYLDFPTYANVTDYRRDLDIDSAVASVNFLASGVRFRREIFVSAPDQVIIVRLKADKPGQISFSAGVTTPQKISAVSVERTNTLILSGTGGEMRGIKGVVRFQSRLQIVPEGGTLSATSNRVTVASANAVTLYIAAATSYKNYQDVSGNPELITKQQLAEVTKKKLPNI